MKQVTTFSIVAAVSFTIPKRLKAAFGKYHQDKGNLTKAGEAGTVTAAGVKFFATREGRDWSSKETRADYEAAIKSIGYEAKNDDPLAWPQKRGVYLEPGKGFAGKAAFYYALCKLTQEAQKALASAKPKATTGAAKVAVTKTTAKPKTTVKAPAKVSAKLATVKA